MTLAVEGKLVPQDPADEPASVLLKIQAENGRLIAEGKIKRDKPLVEIGEEEKAFELLQGGVGGDLAMYQSTAMASAFLCADLRQRLAERQSVEARLAEALVQEVA